MAKYKDLPQAEKDYVDYVQMRWLRVFWFTIFIPMGVWMLLSPEKPEHRSIEKATVALLKELWGIPTGIIFLAIGIIGISYYLYKVLSLRKFAWIKFSNGYYLFEGKKRISGLSSIYNQGDLLAFYPEKQLVLSMEGYVKSTLNKYTPAKLSESFNNDEIYWNADDKGYGVIYKGKSLLNTSSEFRGDDLVVKSSEKHISVLLKDYKSSKDGKIRTAKLVN